MRMFAATEKSIAHRRGMLASMLLSGSGAWLIITAGGWTLGWRSLWAFSYLMYVPAPVRWAMACLLVVGAILVNLPRVRLHLRAVVARLDRVPPRWWLVISCILFVPLREQTYHGDALLKLRLLATATLQSDPYVWKEPLDSLLVYATAGGMRRFGLPPEDAVALWSTVAGVFYVGVAHNLARQLGGDAPPHVGASWATGLLFAVLVTAAWIGVNGTLHLVSPHAGERHLYTHVQRFDFWQRLDSATITPSEPICAAATGCDRVAVTEFTMPQTGDTRPVIFAHAPAEIRFAVRVPAREAFVWATPALDPVAWGWGGDGVTFEIAISHNGGEDLLWRRHLRPDHPDDLGWHEVMVPLDAYLGQHIELVLRTLPGPNNNEDADRAGWGIPSLLEATLDMRFAP